MGHLDRQRIAGLALAGTVALGTAALLARSPNGAPAADPGQGLTVPLPRTTLLIQNYGGAKRHAVIKAQVEIEDAEASVPWSKSIPSPDIQ